MVGGSIFQLSASFMMSTQLQQAAAPGQEMVPQITPHKTSSLCFSTCFLHGLNQQHVMCKLVSSMGFVPGCS